MTGAVVERLIYKAIASFASLEECKTEIADYLQYGITIEFATIPPYLTALYSLQDKSADAYQIIRSVALEEMLHINLVCNLMNAIGYSPKFVGHIASYPATLLPPVLDGPRVQLMAASEEKTNMPDVYQIFPAIGIARVGNSEEYYLAPETPGGLPILTNGGSFASTDFRDGEKKLRRQGARFRIYRYREAGGPPEEMLVGENDIAQIIWHVRLANKKATWYEFRTKDGENGYGPNHPLRNPTVEKEDRQSLMIDPGSRTLTDVSQSVYFDRNPANNVDFLSLTNPISFPVSKSTKTIINLPCPLTKLISSIPNLFKLFILIGRII